MGLHGCFGVHNHFLKLWERIIEARLREIVNIRENQFGFRPGMSTTEPGFALRQLQQKCRENNNDSHMVFVDLEKAFDRIPRDLIWWCLRKKGVPEESVKIVQDMYRSSKTQVVTQKGETEYFTIEVGLHQGSVSPESSLIHYNNGHSNGKHREGSTMGDDVRGRPGAVCYDS